MRKVLVKDPVIDPRYTSYKLSIRRSGIHRYGVYALERIPARRKVIEYTGKKLNRKQAKRADHTYLFTLDNYWSVDGAVGGSGAELKAPYTQEEFQKQLASRKMSVEDMKAQLKRDLSITKLFNKEITSHISISDKDVSDFYNANKTSFNLPEPRVHLAQILVTPAPDPNVRNLKNDKAQNDEQARKKIEMLLARIHQGEDWVSLAQNFSEDPTSATNGGDLGFVPESTLEKANPEIRKAILTGSPGQVTPVVKTEEGYRIFKILAREPSGQRELNDPRVQQNIRETLVNRKDQLLRAAYYEVARDEAKVANYLAETIAQTSGKK